MAQQSQPDDLATALARMARDLLAQETVQHTVDRIVEHAVALVDGCEAAGIVTVESGTPRTLAATNRIAAEADRIQAELGEGPCLDDTLPEARVYRVEDMATERRWPGYASKAHEAGIGSAMGFLLYTRDRQLGALNVYGSGAHAFGEHSEHVGWLLGSPAAGGRRPRSRRPPRARCLAPRPPGAGRARGRAVGRGPAAGDREPSGDRR